MVKEQLIEYVKAKFPSATVEDSPTFPVLTTGKENLFSIAESLKNDAETRFDFLFCETAIDKLTHFEVVYNLYSIENKHHLIIKVKLDDRENPEVDSVFPLWKAAELYECEIFDLFGIRFKNHPTLRRIFLGEEWKGYPLRKDYKDDVNVLSL